MNFVTNRDITIASTSGHTVEFIKNKPTHVPPGMYAEVQAIGAVPEDDIEEPANTKPVVPEDPIERKRVIFEAFTQLQKDNKRGNFSGTGFPHIKAIGAQSGIMLDEKERDALWTEFAQQKA